MNRVFVDTSAWFAYANRRDVDHRAVRDVIGAHSGALITSNSVFGETVTLCLGKLGHAVAARVGEFLLQSDSLQLVRLTAQDEQKAWQLFLDRPDKTYSYTDCTSFVLMRRLGLTQALALDRDFQREGFELLCTPP